MPAYYQSFVAIKSRVVILVVNLGWFDLDLWSSHDWWATTVAIYCPNRVVEHPKIEPSQLRCMTGNVISWDLPRYIKSNSIR